MVQILEPHAQWDTYPWWQEYAQFNLEQNGMGRICLWEEEGALSVFRTRLRYLTKDPVTCRVIVKCRRTQQPNGRTRYDLWFQGDLASGSELHRALQRGGHMLKWDHRPHVTYVDRLGRGISPSKRRRREPPTPPPHTPPLYKGRQKWSVEDHFVLGPSTLTE